MAGTSIEQLHLSVRASNVLYRMGIDTVEELVKTPLEAIAEQRNIGEKTLCEIQAIVESLSKSEEFDEYSSTSEDVVNNGYSDEQLTEMSRHSINEIDLSVRSYNALNRAGYTTLDKVATLTESDYASIKGLGKQSVDEVKSLISNWVYEYLGMSGSLEVNPKVTIEDELKRKLQKVERELEPVVHVYWLQLYNLILSADNADQMLANDLINIESIIRIPGFQPNLLEFFEHFSRNGIINKEFLHKCLLDLNLTFDYNVLIKTALDANIIYSYRDSFLISRETFSDAFNRLCGSNDRSARLLQLRAAGETLQDIGDAFGLTRERVRQITNKLVKQFPLLFEDYFREPYCWFYFSKERFLMAFPEVSDEGFGYLSIRYPHGHVKVSQNTIEEYNGAWKNRLKEFISQETERHVKKTVSKTDIVMRVLMSDSDTALTMEELENEYYRYVERKGFPVKRLTLNIRTLANHLRNARGIVFNRDNKVRYCDADPMLLWTNIDFSLYKNTVISSELIFRDYIDLMDEMDIRDGYELFYVIKSSLSMWNNKEFSIWCRRVPVIVLGDASEEAQAMKLLKELSPISCNDYFAAYEERYGIRKESVQGNPEIYNAVGPYNNDGVFVIDAPVIDNMDVPNFVSALSRKTIWFIEEIEDLFEQLCTHSSRDAINSSAFKRIGYILNSGYAYNKKYGTVANYLDLEVFKNDIIDLNSLDRRLVNLSVFFTALDRKKKSLEYIETAPRVLMSMKKIGEIYGITIDDVHKMQSDLSRFYNLPFFNGHSIWRDIEKLPLVQKLQNNDWLLTSIIKQQELIWSLSIGGGVILSLDPELLSVSNICEWIVSKNGKMTINTLEKKFNDIFGTRINSYKLAEKLKSSGAWDRVVTDSMDDYIDSLFVPDFTEIDEEKLLQEEFL